MVEFMIAVSTQALEIASNLILSPNSNIKSDKTHDFSLEELFKLDILYFVIVIISILVILQFTILTIVNVE